MSVRRIVVGVDGSDNAAAAVRWTAALAVQLGAEVVAVHAFEPLALLGEVPPPVDFAALRAAAEEDLQQRWCEPLHAAG
ncbi:MAG: universal stress protein, partial [Acidimicrobiia bacterium]